MNYIWDIIIKSKQRNINLKNIKFLPAKVYSPYMELSNIYINLDDIKREIEINPYYRFHEIFKDMYKIDNLEDESLRNYIFDILIHFLGNIDIHSGMNKQEYYMKFILKDIENGALGKKVKEDIVLFEAKEKVIILENILKLYKIGETLQLLKSTVKKIFRNSIIYLHNEEKDEILFFINKEKNEKDVSKLKLIKHIFLPIGFSTEVYWGNHFGMIGVEKTMVINNIQIY